ncbi:class I SAM-dependent methyltransferase [Colwellia psychrerythraea]|uniref:UbiE/COQ5 methyltransferase n=1 Tax=Colwellia psychrerythraea TaxID=28229 RepID=A0A099KYN5_COLPS|nr:class I SAM-dependent methyltransferase [Colwellia psychrerythraea]KGJ94962.1 UbiE/COQ5 methyltransferase [Colwellia psychrerythraea]
MMKTIQGKFPAKLAAKLAALSTISLLAFATPLLAGTLDLSGRSDKDIEQDLTRKPVQIIDFVGVKKGDKVLDLLAGGGYYSELLSRVVGDKGAVTLQIPKAYLKYAEKALDVRLANDRLKNVTYLLSEADNLKLSENTYDSAFLVLGFHDMFFQDKGWDFTADEVMPQVLKSLKKGGKLLVIDHDAAENSGIRDVKTLHRIDSAFVKADLEKRGFKFIKTSKLLENDNDDHSKLVFVPELRRKTDRFVMLFEKI